MSRLLAAVLLLLAGPAIAADPPTLDLSSFHAEASLVNSRDGATIQAEVWIRAPYMRMEMSTPMGTQATLMRDDTVYVWQPGQNRGMKTTLTPAQRATSLLAVNDCLKTAESLGQETVDGVVCERWRYVDCGSTGSTTTIWIPIGQHWPKKLVNVTARGTKTVVYRNADVRAKITEEQVATPTGIDFQDMAEMMERANRAQQPPRR